MPRKWPERTLKEIDLRLFLHFLELQKDACGIGTVSENGIVKPMTQAILFFWGGGEFFFLELDSQDITFPETCFHSCKLISVFRN